MWMSVLRSRMLTAQLGLPKTVFVCKSERRVSIDFNESIHFYSVVKNTFATIKFMLEKKKLSTVCASLSAWVCSLFSGSFLPWSYVPVCGWGNLTTADAAYTATMPSLVVPSVQPISPPAGPVEPSTLQPSCAPSPWRRMTFFPTGSHIVPASPHARGAGTLQQAGGTSKAGRPTAAACRSSSQLQFVIIIKGLTSEASLPLFTPPSHPW